MGAKIYRFPMADPAKNFPATTSPTEEAGAAVAPGGEVAILKESSRSFLAAARRNLTAEELASPGALRLLIAELERLDQVCSEHQTIVTEYHSQRVIVATLTEQLGGARKLQILSN